MAPPLDRTPSADREATRQPSGDAAGATNSVEWRDISTAPTAADPMPRCAYPLASAASPTAIAAAPLALIAGLLPPFESTMLANSGSVSIIVGSAFKCQ